MASEFTMAGKGSLEKVYRLLVLHILLLTIHSQELVLWPRKVRNFERVLEIIGAYILLFHKNWSSIWGQEIFSLVVFFGFKMGDIRTHLSDENSLGERKIKRKEAAEKKISEDKILWEGKKRCNSKHEGRNWLLTFYLLNQCHKRKQWRLVEVYL